MNGAPSLAELERSATRFTTMAALRLIEQVAADRPRLGESRRAAQDAVRVTQPPSLAFANTDIEYFGSKPEGGAEAPVLSQHAFGLLGPNGPMPLHFTEYVFRRLQRGGYDDPTLHDFLSLLQHRLATLFYRAWADSDPATCRDRPDADGFARVVAALVGLGAENAGDELDDVVRSAAGLCVTQARTADGLMKLLTRYFKMPFELRPYAGEWLPIPAADRSRLGTAGTGARLGEGLTLGASSWQCQHRFELVAGPLSRMEFERLLPGTQGLAALAKLVRFHTNDEWAWQLRLRLREPDVGGVVLGGTSALGWTSWLGQRGRNGDDVLLQEENCRNAQKAS